MPKLLVLTAKGSGFGSHVLDFAKHRVRRSFGLGGQARKDTMGRGLAVDLPN